MPSRAKHYPAAFSKVEVIKSTTLGASKLSHIENKRTMTKVISSEDFSKGSNSGPQLNLHNYKKPNMSNYATTKVQPNNRFFNQIKNSGQNIMDEYQQQGPQPLHQLYGMNIEKIQGTRKNFLNVTSRISFEEFTAFKVTEMY